MNQRLISVTTLTVLASALAILQGCATAPPPAPKAAAAPAPAPAPVAAAPAPAWKQGMGPDMANSKLSSFARKNDGHPC